ncbi:sodium bicarbonate transporter-like protein 11 [Lingula anatina]|uniref:Sodium bicarbonate transporter-like protein 11 n=1 Tax=Lingula anatina TaxID=7574 RepID=A0A1S3IGM1_LINAN|nr:sodium bicarbonate transporter-like protein 11 [Lingula anatina]|eukprot:XP_013396619.1 sodium bicarbonate transporter-like protein 11 [Lingula anatina]
MSAGHNKLPSLQVTDLEPGDMTRVYNEGLTLPVPNKLPPIKPTGISPAASVLVLDTEIEMPDCRRDRRTSLMLSRHEPIPLNDLREEETANTMKLLIENAHVLLDVHESRLDDITRNMLSTTFGSSAEFDTDKLMDAIFTHDNVHCLSKTIQGTSDLGGGGFDYDQSWVVVLGLIPELKSQTIAICSLKHAANLGHTSQEVKFVIYVLADESGSKEALVTGQALATIFADLRFRQELHDVHNVAGFKQLLLEHSEELSKQESKPDMRKGSTSEALVDELKGSFYPGRGMLADLKRRLPYYWSDYRDGIVGPNTISKCLSSTIFLYFSCLLPTIAFSEVNHKSTHGAMAVKDHIIAQTIAGMVFSLFGGQPMMIIMTTAPISLFIIIIDQVAESYGVDFPAMYSCVGLFNALFLILYAVFDVSQLAHWSTRSTEEITAVFVSAAFIFDAGKDIVYNFDVYYKSCDDLSTELVNVSNVSSLTGVDKCQREISMLYLLLAIGTLLVGTYLYNFTHTPFLSEKNRELLADYALPISCLLMTFVGSYIFQGIKLGIFEYKDELSLDGAPLNVLTIGNMFLAMGLALPLSLLFFMDQSLASAEVNSAPYKLEKGPAYHWDMFVLGVINAVLSVYGLPWVHGAIPQSQLHVRALADVESRVDQGHISQIIIRVRETRLDGVLSHILIGLSLLMVPYPLGYIPTPVLDGLLLYLAIIGLFGNQLFERMMLLFTDVAAYHPNHYIRNIPLKTVFLFTLAQLIQLIVLCTFGFAPHKLMKPAFPAILVLLIPIRHKIAPKFFEKKHLDLLDARTLCLQ